MLRTDVSDSHAVAPHAVSPIDTRAVPSASPACTPCTVTHDEPVPGMLAWRSELRSGTDPDRRSEAELTLKAEVSRTRRLPTAPPGYARQTIDESETHVVDWHVSSPIRDVDETEAGPMPVPCRVTLTEPVAAVLLLSAPLTVAAPSSPASTATMLPSRLPAVTDTRPILLDPCGAEQSAEVCDAQVVASQALRPNRPDGVWTTSAMLAPSTLTCRPIDPGAARFDACARPSSARSTLQPDETLPMSASTVSPSCLLPASPRPARHASNVSELHIVASQAVPPARADALASDSPMPRPCTVTRVEPVAAALSCRPPLALGVSAEYPPVPLPIWFPAVTETRLLPPTPCAVRQRVDESDSHSVPSHAVPPAIAAALIAPIPMPPPSTCRLADPVRPALRPPTMRIHPEAADTAAVTLPVWRAAVSVALRLAASQWAVRARAAVSDSHVLCSHELRPVLLHAVCAVDPKFCPYTVTSAVPVPPAFDTATALRSVEATERAPLTLPTPRPTVSDSLTLLARPDPARHTTDVSAAHDVDSLEDGP